MHSKRIHNKEVVKEAILFCYWYAEVLHVYYLSRNHNKQFSVFTCSVIQIILHNDNTILVLDTQFWKQDTRLDGEDYLDVFSCTSYIKPKDNVKSFLIFNQDLLKYNEQIIK